MTNNKKLINDVRRIVDEIEDIVYRYNSTNDFHGEILARKVNVCKSISLLVDAMIKYDVDVVMTTHNAHDSVLVEEINDAWNNPFLHDNFFPILKAIISRDSDEAENIFDRLPSTYDEVMEHAQTIMEEICDNNDLQTILCFVGYKKER